MKISEYDGNINDKVTLYTEWQALIGLYQTIGRDIYRIPFDIEHDIITDGSGDMIYEYYDGVERYYVYDDGTVSADGDGEGIIGQIKLDYNDKIDSFN